MEEKSTTRRSVFAFWRWPRWVLVLFMGLLLLGYPLSVGPFAYLANKGYIPNSAAVAFGIGYLPLMLICHFVPSLQALLEWYLNFCGAI